MTARAVLAVWLLALAACARAESTAAFAPIERVSDLSPREFLLRVRALALSDRPSDPAVYEPLLGLTTGGSMVIPGAGTETGLAWRDGNGGFTGRRFIPSSPKFDPAWADVSFTLPAMGNGPCVTFEDLIAVFGPNYDVMPHSVPRSGDNRPMPYPPGVPFNAGFRLRESPAARASFIALYPCVGIFRLSADR